MLNPGHVDPGYDGYLRFTVINMGKDVIEMKRNDLIFTALFTRLGQNVQSDFGVRNPGHAGLMPGAEEVNRLTRDFLDFERRVDARIDKADQKLKYFGIVTPILVAAITLIVTQVSGWLNVSDLKVKVEKLEALDRDALRQKRIEDLSGRVEQLRGSVPTLRRRPTQRFPRFLRRLQRARHDPTNLRSCPYGLRPGNGARLPE